MPDGGAAEVALTADYNAEMIEQIARYPRMRDRSIFVGNPADLVDDPLGPGLPSVREWTTAHFAFAGYVTGAPPVADRAALREQLGYRPDECVCVVAVGGSGVGAPLLRRIADAFPHAAAKLPELRMVVVCGPRINPAAVPVPPGVEVRGYVPELHRELAACDVRGGAGRADHDDGARGRAAALPLLPARPPLRATGARAAPARAVPAGRRMEYAAADPERIAEELVRALDTPSTTCPSRPTAPAPRAGCSPSCCRGWSRPPAPAGSGGTPPRRGSPSGPARPRRSPGGQRDARRSSGSPAGAPAPEVDARHRGARAFDEVQALGHEHPECPLGMRPASFTAPMPSCCAIRSRARSSGAARQVQRGMRPPTALTARRSRGSRIHTVQSRRGSSTRIRSSDALRHSSAIADGTTWRAAGP
jgi:hypothetical protein